MSTECYETVAVDRERKGLERRVRQLEVLGFRERLL